MSRAREVGYLDVIMIDNRGMLFRVKRVALTTGCLLLATATDGAEKPLPTITDDKLSTHGRLSMLEEGWLFHSGDDADWADPQLEDGDWLPSGPTRTVKSFGDDPWVGIGWFRLRFLVPDAVAAQDLALYVHQVGASEIFVNGAFLRGFGTVSASPEDEVAHHTTDLVAYPIDLVPGENVIAVRYSDQAPKQLKRLGDAFGAHIALAFARDAHLEVAAANRHAGAHLAAITALPAIFCVLHLLLFLFYPATRQNLHYAVFAAALTMLNFNVFNHDFMTTRSDVAFFSRLLEVSIVIVSISGTRFVYSCFYSKLPKQLYLIAIVGLLALIPWSETRNAVSIFSLICLAEMMRVMITAVIRKHPGSGILAVGGGLFFLACSYELLGMLQLVPHLVENIYVYGVLAMMGSMSVFLAREFAGVNRSLGDANERLIEYSHTLEERVDARTQELSAKNEELEQVLTELRGAQNRMILQEKMASLGGLVAGIAHEINSPVGAIISVRDTMKRAHSRLRGDAGGQGRQQWSQGRLRGDCPGGQRHREWHRPSWRARAESADLHSAGRRRIPARRSPRRVG